MKLLEEELEVSMILAVRPVKSKERTLKLTSPMDRDVMAVVPRSSPDFLHDESSGCCWCRVTRPRIQLLIANL